MLTLQQDEKQQRYGTTLTKRMRTTTNSVSRLARMKTDYEPKARIIRAKMIPKAFYG